MRFNDYEASFEALRAGVAVEPAWLGRRILSADSEKEHVSELGYLLYRMDYLDASKLWKEAGDILMTKISPGKPRSLLHCIARFSDHQKVNFVTEHLSRREDSASGAALAALTILDPLAAINRLVEVEDFDRYLTRNHWLPAILHAQPKLARERILALAEANPNGRRIIDGLFWERPDEIDGPMLSFVLRSLETELGERFDEIVAGNPDRLYHTLDFLGRITDPRLLNILQNEAGSNLERMIVAVACSRLRTNSNYRDDIRENARKLLILIGGEGITTLIGRELASEHFWIRHSGLTWAFVAEDDSIVDQLAALIRRSVPGDASLTAEPDPPLEFLQATRALAALGPDSVLVDILWQTNVLQLPLDLPEFRAHRGPLSKALTEQVREILQSDGAVENLLLIGLAIAEISGDPSLIPLVLSVLSRADPESRIARFSCIAAYHLRASSDEFARLAFLIAQSKENVWWGLKALIALESSGLEYLEKWLQANKNKTDPTHENFVVRALYRNPKTRKLAIDTAVRVSLEGGSFWEEPYDLAAEAVVPALREKIRDKAFAARAFTVTAPLLAIEGLAKFDAPRAVEAIELGLQSHHRIERELCHLLVKIAPELAAKKLIDAAVSIERESLRRAAGQALRRLDGAIVTTLVLERITGSATVRKAAAEIAGWLLIPEITKALESLAHDDTTIEIRNAALNALERHRREDNIRALFEAFPSMPPKRQWSLLVAIVENGDPYLLTDRQDSLWLGRILRDVPFAFEHYANSVLGRRKKDGDR
jgi:hypothetical protein